MSAATQQAAAKAAIRRMRGNEVCAECAAPQVEWLVLEYGVVVCIRCAGGHRGLGSHICKVRSIDLDDFSEAELQWAQEHSSAMGNAKSNAIFEAALPAPALARMRRPAADASDTVRRIWLRAKYDEQRFVAGAKRADFLPAWRSRFFALGAGGTLSYFTDESCSAQSQDSTDPLLLRLTFESAVGHAGGAFRTRVDSAPSPRGRVVRLLAASQQEADAWVWALYHATHAARSSTMPTSTQPAQRLIERRLADAPLEAAEPGSRSGGGGRQIKEDLRGVEDGSGYQRDFRPELTPTMHSATDPKRDVHLDAVGAQRPAHIRIL
ncbi:hypothetical protein EMIHUDRAFT_631917 [Emiliania huxleyi CCMP1516]|uniref:Arf-GAP domain-containing protein n=2 Tax=Emiliania huxleyi TaxID=2903 RepID=A0A0D3K101_EMIH1|nr:hypothetical protein EMIHUDRAFT_631917 [Emiliania huxleyi CCMP1516]EOD29436.1 hypothetical protein EMIHUDRAFT_631917 [Emiliania huxleyi CCMP1516]|eukprot:XP_005781865.1 hypothetical protein EMIHUDRAFT_631917 [Emiliania huxleyi CCMP1516]